MIYRALLENDFEKLPGALRRFHSTPGRRSAAGVLSIRRENSVLAWLVGFPPEGDRVPVTLEVAASEDEEIWTRRFGNLVRRSTQSKADGLLIEKAGPVRVAFQVRASTGGMRFVSVQTTLWGIPVPLRIEASVFGAETSWEIEVKIAHVGSYRGALELSEMPSKL